jgi:hypothetical protein
MGNCESIKERTEMAGSIKPRQIRTTVTSAKGSHFPNLTSSLQRSFLLFDQAFRQSPEAPRERKMTKQQIARSSFSPLRRAYEPGPRAG